MDEKAVEEAETADLAGRIIEAFEDFLWVHQVDLHNMEPRPEGDDGETIIYGRDYQDLFNDLFEIIDSYK